MIIVYAGNRIDETGRAERRFPESNIAQVRTRVAEVLAASRPDLVVGAAAAGADLIVLDEAHRASISAHVVLPLDIEEFRRASVVDRADEWNDRFDLEIARSIGLTVCDLSRFEDWYLRGNDLILDTAVDLSEGALITALVVASPHDRGSASNDFREKVKTRHWPIVSIDPTDAAPTHAAPPS